MSFSTRPIAEMKRHRHELLAIVWLVLLFYAVENADCRKTPMTSRHVLTCENASQRITQNVTSGNYKHTCITIEESG